MQHRGVEYQVVRTIVKSWRWSVKKDHTEKIGTTETREIAVRRAHRFIDEMLDKQEQDRL
jgi:hypothetical protein